MAYVFLGIIVDGNLESTISFFFVALDFWSDLSYGSLKIWNWGEILTSPKRTIACRNFCLQAEIKSKQIVFENFDKNRYLSTQPQIYHPKWQNYRNLKQSSKNTTFQDYYVDKSTNVLTCQWKKNLNFMSNFFSKEATLINFEGCVYVRGAIFFRVTGDKTLGRCPKNNFTGGRPKIF